MLLCHMVQKATYSLSNTRKSCSHAGHRCGRAVKNAPYAAVIEEDVGYYNDTLSKYPLVNTSKE